MKQHFLSEIRWVNHRRVHMVNARRSWFLHLETDVNFLGFLCEYHFIEKGMMSYSGFLEDTRLSTNFWNLFKVIQPIFFVICVNQCITTKIFIFLLTGNNEKKAR